MGNFAVEAGRALRRVRRARGLTLRAVAFRHGIKASTVAAYERADRNISLERFYALCRIYRVDAARLLADIVRVVEGREPVVIDLTRLESLAPPDRELVERFVSQVRRLRHEDAARDITIRAMDLEALATTSGRREDEFLSVLSPALRRPSPSSAAPAGP